MIDLKIQKSPQRLVFKIDKPNVKVHLKARKNIAGDVMIYDHPDIDIVISPRENKIFALTKKEYSDHVYATQSRLFEFLSRNGVVNASKVRSGNVFGSLEAVVLVAEDKQKQKVDRGYREYEAEFDKDLVDPPEDETTALGKVPHEPRKGSMYQAPGYMASYGLVGYYEE